MQPKVLQSRHSECLERNLRGTPSQDVGCTLIEFENEEDHAHFFISCHLSMQMSVFVNSLKAIKTGIEHQSPHSPLLAQVKQEEAFYWKKIEID